MPRHTFQSVVEELAAGLENGSIQLEEPAPLQSQSASALSAAQPHWYSGRGVVLALACGQAFSLLLLLLMALFGWRFVLRSGEEGAKRDQELQLLKQHSASDQDRVQSLSKSNAQIQQEVAHLERTLDQKDKAFVALQLEERRTRSEVLTLAGELKTRDDKLALLDNTVKELNKKLVSELRSRDDKLERLTNRLKDVDSTLAAIRKQITPRDKGFESYVTREMKGKIKNVSADTRGFTLTDRDGKDHEFVLAFDGKVQVNDKSARLGELKEGDEVTITYEQKDGKLVVSKIECQR
jgi:Cu/Ag efflux protein CusF